MVAVGAIAFVGGPIAIAANAIYVTLAVGV